MPPIPNGQTDPYLFLLERIDSRQEEQGADIKAMRGDLADGRVKFENHEGRLRALETPRHGSPATDRAERKTKPEAESERLSVGAWLKIMGAVGTIAALVIGAYFAGQGKPPDHAPTAQGAKS